MAKGSSPPGIPVNTHHRSNAATSTHLLEVGASGEDLVHEILNGEDVVLAECRLDDGVVGQRDALLVDLAVAALVDQLADSLQVGLAACPLSGVDEVEHDQWLTRR